MSLDEALSEAIKILSDAGINDARIDAELLLEYTCNINRAYRLAHGNEEVNITCEDDKLNKYKELIELRAKRVPLQHLVGYQDFMGLRFKVNSDVLIPRYDTEILVEETLKRLHDGMCILDMCTGSGCILTSLLHYSNGCTGVYADISDKALSVAKENSDIILENKEIDITRYYVNGDLFEGLVSARKQDGSLPTSFDIIVSNPPYIETDIINTLETEVKDYDPRIALDGGADGLTFYRRIIESAMDYLNGAGLLIFEIGYNQAADVKKLMIDRGFIDVEVIKDLAGLDRVVVGSKSCLTN